jgi:hypothetical protein
MTRPAHEVERVLFLHGLGLNSCQIARETGIARQTFRPWIRNPVRSPARKIGCFRCDESQTVGGHDYVYLLGLYLGDGWLSAHPRGVWRLRIVQDARYVELIERCGRTIAAVSGNRVQQVAKVGCVEIGAFWKHWVHVFPQHARGVKHERAIRLEPWQQELVSTFPKALLAGLIHSDGCRAMNTVKATTKVAGPQRYTYPRYQFSNTSEDIRRIFTDTCELLGVRWTRANLRNIAVSRRADVVFLDTFIGPKR